MSHRKIIISIESRRLVLRFIIIMIMIVGGMVISLQRESISVPSSGQVPQTNLVSMTNSPSEDSELLNKCRTNEDLQLEVYIYNFRTQKWEIFDFSDNNTIFYYNQTCGKETISSFFFINKEKK